jgi:hypothetical protein
VFGETLKRQKYMTWKNKIGEHFPNKPSDLVVFFLRQILVNLNRALSLEGLSPWHQLLQPKRNKVGCCSRWPSTAERRLKPVVERNCYLLSRFIAWWKVKEGLMVVQKNEGESIEFTSAAAFHSCQWGGASWRCVASFLW